MEFTCIFYDVFDVGGFAGSSLRKGSLLYILRIPPLPLLTITSRYFVASFLLSLSPILAIDANWGEVSESFVEKFRESSSHLLLLWFCS